MIYAVSGSRTITDEKAIERILSQYFGFKDQLNVGDARGVDAIATDLANRRFMDVEIFKANWDAFGKSAGPIRNALMLDNADQLVAIWDGKSKGTKNTIDLALKYGIDTKVYFVK